MGVAESQVTTGARCLPGRTWTCVRPACRQLIRQSQRRAEASARSAVGPPVGRRRHAGQTRTPGRASRRIWPTLRAPRSGGCPHGDTQQARPGHGSAPSGPRATGAPRTSAIGRRGRRGASRSIPPAVRSGCGPGAAPAGPRCPWSAG